MTDSLTTYAKLIARILQNLNAASSSKWFYMLSKSGQKAVKSRVFIKYIRKLWSDFDHSFCFLTTYLTTSGSKTEKTYGNNGPKATKNAPKTPAEMAKKGHSQQKEVVKYFWELDVVGSSPVTPTKKQSLLYVGVAFVFVVIRKTRNKTGAGFGHRHRAHPVDE